MSPALAGRFSTTAPPAKPLVSILNLYPKIFKVVQAAAFRLVTNKNIEMLSNTKARLSAHEYNVLGSI